MNAPLEKDAHIETELPREIPTGSKKIHQSNEIEEEQLEFGLQSYRTLLDEVELASSP